MMHTPRVVVIDEDRDEAFHLLQALGQIGVGAVYISGDDLDSLPEAPLHGVRVVFLDLKLINQPEVKHYLPYTVQVLERCVQMGPRTTGIICWTKHEPEVQLLKEELVKRNIQPSFVLAIEDKLRATRNGDVGIRQVQDQLREMLLRHPGWPSSAGPGLTSPVA